jgi:hypothetical protein
VLRQAAFLAHRRALNDLALRIIDLEALRQMNDLLAPEGLLVERQDDFVRDHIVDAVGTRGPGVSEIAHLDGRGPMRKNAETVISRIAVEVDRDVDPELAEQLRDFAVITTAHIMEMIEGLD